MSVLTWVVEGIRKMRVFAKLSYGRRRLRRSEMLTKLEVSNFTTFNLIISIIHIPGYDS